MFTATRDWFRRNRRTIAIGAGVVGTAYLAGQYVLGKINEARQRMSDERIARENLRRRFAQNQEDCTYTTLALLPTATENCLKAIPTEDILSELQARKSEKTARSTASSEIAPSEVPTEAEEGRSYNSSSISGSYVHASRVVGSAGNETAESSSASGTAGSGEAMGMAVKTKTQLWDDLKISSVTRAFTLIYTLCLLTLLTRIQLNLLGRRTYLSSVVSLASPQPEGSKISLENRDDDNLEQDYGSDFETNRKYLTFSWWLLHRGWEQVMGSVETAVRDVFGVLAPRDNVSFAQLADLTLEVRRRVEGASEEERRERKWLQYLLPTRADEEVVLRESGVSIGASSESSSPSTSPEDSARSQGSGLISSSLRRLLDETSDLVDSPPFSHVLTLTLDAAFSLLVDDKLATQAFRLPSNNPSDALISGATPRIQEIPDDASSNSQDPKSTTAKLATILAVFTRQAHVIGAGGDLNAIMGASSSSPEMTYGGGGGQPPTQTPLERANEYLACVERVRDLEAFAAVVYSSNFEFEGADIPGGIEEVIAEEEAQGLDTQRMVRTVEETLAETGADLQGSLESAWGKARAVVTGTGENQ